MSLKRGFLILAPILIATLIILSAVLVSQSKGNESLYSNNGRPKAQATGSNIFSRRYSTQHPPCYGRLTSEIPTGFGGNGPSP